MHRYPLLSHLANLFSQWSMPLIMFSFILLLCVYIAAAIRHDVFVDRKYFEDALEKNHAVELVSVHGRTLRVTDGNVDSLDSLPISSSETLTALRLAYAATLARRSPIIGIAGTDPATLLSETEQLKEATDRVASLQKDSGDAELIRSSLYPITFLTSLAHAERTRVAFLQTPSVATLTHYLHSVDIALEEGGKNAQQFSGALRRIGPVDDRFYIGIMQRFSFSDMQQAADELAALFQRLSSTHRKRATCLFVDVAACVPSDLSLIDISSRGLLYDTPQLISRASDIDDLYQRANDRPRAKDEYFTILNSSVCMSGDEPPYVFMTWKKRNTGEPTFAIKYRNDLFFTEIHASTQPSLARYLREEHELTYLHLNPTKFYMCPHIGRDTGLVYAIDSVGIFAQMNPSIAKEKQKRLFKTPGVLEETPAREYVEAALDEVGQDGDVTTMHALEEIRLMFTEKSGGLEFLIQDITHTLQEQIRFKEEEKPTIMGSQELFLSRHAFPSLYLTHNSSGPHETPYIEPFPEHETSLLRLLRLTILQHTVDTQKLINDLRTILTTEGDMF